MNYISYILAVAVGFAFAITVVLYVVGDGDDETSLWPD